MWIVQLALRRPYTFIVAALLLLIVSPLVILRTPTDIFPNINIPVVSIVWQYSGMPPTEFAGRITSVYERALTTTVNDIEHIESQTFNGVGVIKVFFQPSAKIEAALAQVTAIAQTITRQTPAGVTPPLVITYNASSVPILQLGLSGEGLSEQQLNDFAMNNIRTLLATVARASPGRMAGKCGKSQSISICKSSTASASRPTTCSPRSTRRTSSCPPAP
jgi:multidrug efflux pump subunit AcrB